MKPCKRPRPYLLRVSHKNAPRNSERALAMRCRWDGFSDFASDHSLWARVVPKGGFLDGIQGEMGMVRVSKLPAPFRWSCKSAGIQLPARQRLKGGRARMMVALLGASVRRRSRNEMHGRYVARARRTR